MEKRHDAANRDWVMDLFNENFPLKLLMGYLDKDQSGRSLDMAAWKQLEDSFGSSLYADILYMLTQQKFDPDLARGYWYEILDHRENMSQAVGRDVGLRVSVLDYFLNVKPRLKDLVFVEIGLFLEKERNAFLDELTSLYNRRYFSQVLTKEVEYARRYNQPFSLQVLDIDNFKSYNDINGHQAGDDALSGVANVLQLKARAIDHVIRYGGEEFVVLLPRSDRTEGLIAAERYREAVEEYEFPGEEGLPGGKLTVSIGLAVFPYDAETGLDLFKRADEALYQSKKSGRNQVTASVANKRSEPRFPIEAELMFRLREAAETTTLRGQSRDISLGGLLCQTDERLEVGQTLEVLLPLPKGGDPLSLQAQAVRLIKDKSADSGYLLGLSFQLDEEGLMAALKKVVAEYSEDSD